MGGRMVRYGKRQQQPAQGKEKTEKGKAEGRA
jgi:hypothetical protein